MSCGNVTQAVQLADENLTLVLGNNLDLGGDGSRNGTGKTTLINAISYALYGAALSKIKADNLINKTNAKQMVVTVDFDYNGEEYRIERGRKPNIFRLLRDGVDLNDLENEAHGEMRHTQVEVTNIIGISHLMFKHIVALNTYTEPFLSMRAADQREVIEELLGITELSNKAETLKTSMKIIKDKIKDEEYNIKALQTSNEKILKSIDDIRRRQRVWKSKHKSDLQGLKDALDALSHVNIESELKIHSDLVIYNEKQSKITEANKWISSINRDNTKQESLIEKLNREIELLEGHKCHACGQDIHDTKQEEILKNKRDMLTEANMQILSNLSQEQDHHTIIAEIGDLEETLSPFYPTAEDAYEHQTSVKSLSDQLITISKAEDPYESQIHDMERNSLEEISYSVLEELTLFKDHQEFLMKLLSNKDSFVRKKIIDQNLNFLNTRLEHYISELGLPHSVKFQNDLSVDISDLGRDLDFDNLSRGERNRLILGLSWAFRDIFESMYSSINILFVDELIDSGMDTNGVESSLSVLKKMTREMNRSIFLISHKEELTGRVGNILNVTKENGFTTFTQEDDTRD
jgi:DNA repair exonuclease SbcCD ATPase subunit